MVVVMEAVVWVEYRLGGSHQYQWGMRLRSMVWSIDFVRTLGGVRCFSCGQVNLSPRFHNADTGKHIQYAPALRFTQPVVWVCSHCDIHVSVFSGRQTAGSEVGDYTVVGVSEAARSEEEVGLDRRLIDNSASSISVKRRFSIAKEWMVSYVVESEASRSSGVSIGLGELAKISGAADNAIRERYSISGSEKRMHEEEVTIEVPAKTKVSVVFSWKLIWQHGMVSLTDCKGEMLSIPYKLSQGLTFDQRQIDDP